MIVPTNSVHFDTAIPTSSFNTQNFVVTWKPGLNDLTLHVTFNILLSGLACKMLVLTARPTYTLSGALRLA